MIETEILIVGSGPAGSTAALALSSYGVRNMLVTKHGWLADTPRAHITNQRTFEVLRDLGVEDEAKALAVPLQQVGNAVFCRSLAGEELARIHAFGTHPARQGDYAQASPCVMGDLPQNFLEPVLLGNAAKRGSKVRFDTEYVSHVQDEDSVTTTVRDRLSGKEYRIRSKYLIGADGGRSKVVEDIGLPMEGNMGLAGSLNIVFEADLTRYTAHRPAFLYLVVQAGLQTDGGGIGVIRMVRPWKEWMLIKGYDMNGPAPELNEEQATRFVHDLIGDDSVPVRIKSTSLWTVNNRYATRYSSGRVFCMGDAVHRHPPTNGLGSNTSIQDAYNLAWKLAMVTKGKAGVGLLDSYDAELMPVGRQVVMRANKSIESYGGIFDALGLLDGGDQAKLRANMEARKLPTPKAAVQRENLRKAVAEKNYEYNGHGVEMNQIYVSTAVVVEDGLRAYSKRDLELYYQPMTAPGARLPHVWLQRETELVSTLDLVGKGMFSLLTCIGGEMWKAAASRIEREFGVQVMTYVIGPGRALTDLYGEWAEAREVEESGCLLVRPDGHIAWRARSAARSTEEAEARLLDAMGRILSRNLDEPVGRLKPTEHEPSMSDLSPALS